MLILEHIVRGRVITAKATDSRRYTYKSSQYIFHRDFFCVSFNESALSRNE